MRNGSRSVATLQGWYGFEHPSGPKCNFNTLFRSTCDHFRLSSTPIGIKKQADVFIDKFQRDLVAYLRRIPPGDFTSPFGANDPHVVYLTVAGFDAQVPLVTGRELLVRRQGKVWQAITRDVPGLGLTRCGARFHGQDQVAFRLMQDDPSLPLHDRQRSEVVTARYAEAGLCSPFTDTKAKDLFVTAVRLTVQFGYNFGIVKGEVGGPLKFVVIPRSGSAQEEVIWNY